MSLLRELTTLIGLVCIIQNIQVSHAHCATCPNKIDDHMNILNTLQDILNKEKPSASKEMKENDKYCEKQIKKCEKKFGKCDESYSALTKVFGEKYKNLQSCLMSDKHLNDKLCTCKTENEKCNGNLECCENNLEMCQKGLENCGDMNCPNDLKICQDNLENCECQVLICENNYNHCIEDLEACNTDLNDCEMKIVELHGSIEMCNDEKYYCFGNLTDCLEALNQCNKDICECKDELEDCEERREECEEEKAICDDILIACEANFTDCTNKLNEIKEFCNAPFSPEELSNLCHYNDQVFAFLEPAVTRSEADAACKAKNGNLIVISTVTEFQDMTTMLTTCGKSLVTKYWTGLTDQLTDDSYFYNGVLSPTAGLSPMFTAPIDLTLNCLVYDPSTAATTPILEFADCATDIYKPICLISKPCDGLLELPPPPVC